MQAGFAEQFDLGEFVERRVFETFEGAGGNQKGRTIGEINDNALGTPVEADGYRDRAASAFLCPASLGCLQTVSPFGIVQVADVTGLIVDAQTPAEVLAEYRAAGAGVIAA